MNQFEKDFKKIIINSWVNGDSEKCILRVKRLIGAVIDKCEELKTWTDKEDKCPYKKKVDNSNDYVIIGITSKEELKKKLGLK